LTRAADAHPALKIIVNTQRRYMPFAILYRKLIAEKKLGMPHFVRGNVRGSVLDMSPHLLDCILLLMCDSRPKAVWAAAEGARNFANPNERGPDNLIAEFTFASGARVFFESSQESLGTANFPLPEKFDGWQPERCNLDVWATEGRFWWREYGTWGYQLQGMRSAKVERTHFFRDDISAQHLFTKAIGEWLDDKRKPHHNRFELSRVHMDCLYGAYKSALAGRRLDFPIKVTDPDVAALRRKLRLAEKN
jgi:predicted dehydrogenase